MPSPVLPLPASPGPAAVVAVKFHRLRRSLRWTGDLVKHLFWEMYCDRAFEMAAALTYRTIFSLVPVFVLALVVFHAFGGFESAGEQLRSYIFQQANLNALRINAQATGPGVPGAATTPGTTPATAPAPAGELTASAGQIDALLNQFMQRTENLSFGSIGAVGLILLIWAALALIVNVEDVFNRIYGSPRGRAWHMRIMIYWAILTLGPVLLFASLYITGKAVSIVSAHIGFLGHVLAWLSQFAALLSSWLLLFLLYRLMPNAAVRWRAAATGSFVAAVLWEIGKRGFQLYVQHTIGYSVLYGSLGLVPLFLFWVYLTWVIVLFGLELTYTLQATKGRRFKYLATRAVSDVDPQWLIPILVRIGQAFGRGRTIGVLDLAQELGVPERTVTELAGRLEAQGLIHRAEAAGQRGAGYTLALPPEKIPIAKLLDMARAAMVSGLGGSGTPADAQRAELPGAAMLQRLAQAQKEAAADATLATVLGGG